MTLETFFTDLLTSLSKLSPIRFRTVYSFQQGVKFRFGRDIRLLHPGMYWHWNLVETIMVNDTTEEVVDTDIQTCTTADGVSVCLSASIRYRKYSLRMMWNNVQDFDSSLGNLAEGIIATALREWNYEDALEAIPDLEEEITKSLRTQVSRWGVELKDCKITNFAKARTIRLFSDGIMSSDS